MHKPVAPAGTIPPLIKRNTILLALSQAFVGAGTQLAYGIGKAVQFAFPVFCLWWFDGRWPRWTPPRFDGLPLALAFGLLVGAGVLVLYFGWLRGTAVLSSPMLNRGTAFTLAEREALGLTGLLPGGVSTIEGQLRRVYAQYLRQPDDLAKSLHLGQIRNRNEVLFYRLLS